MHRIRRPCFWKRWLFNALGEFVELQTTRTESSRWSTKHCPHCAAPVATREATYCVSCGQRVNERTTEAISINVATLLPTKPGQRLACAYWERYSEMRGEPIGERTQEHRTVHQGGRR